MTKEQFLEKSKELMGDQAAMMGEALFRVFDEDGRYVFKYYCRLGIVSFD